MLAAMDSNTDVVFVRLLDEGTYVLRPVPAVNIYGDFYELLATDDYDSEFEIWEFTPNSRVRCEKKEFGSETILIAVELVTDDL
jgi:hypothetical protein